MFESIVKKFLYYPLILDKNATPPAYAREASEVFVDTSDGNTIHGLYWPAHDEKRPTILFLHGNAQSVFEWALVKEELEALECGLFLIDYPGYGKSTGKPSEESLYAAGFAAYEHLLSIKIPENKIILLGKSLGGGVSTKICKERNPLGLILESTFQSIPSVISNLIPMVPSDAVLKTERYASIERIEYIKCPILVVHGVEDEIVPYEEGEVLFDAALGSKELYTVKEAGHNDVSLVAGDEYGLKLKKWVDSIIA